MGRAAPFVRRKEGARVVGCGHHAAECRSHLETVRSTDGQMVSLHPCDMSVRSDVDRLVEFASRTMAASMFLYNNASMAYFQLLPDTSSSGAKPSARSWMSCFTVARAVFRT